VKPPIITLLTDFGTQDYFVGAMKGVILSRNPLAQIVDITHEISPQDIHAAAFNLLATYRDFSPGTIHLAVIDPGVGSDRQALIVNCADRLFVGPDNGLFGWICERETEWRAFAVTSERFFRQPISTTFHGRDIFAPVAAALSLGHEPHEFGSELNDIAHLESLKPIKFDDRTIQGRIIHIDRFGNCVTNLTNQELRSRSEPTAWRIILNDQEINSFHSFFAEAAANELFCITGSAGFLEISVRNSSAAKLLNAQRGQVVVFSATTLAKVTPRSGASGQ
jgi:S-adenosyl-L-methionine hydrolase (adenosine-forming)